MRKESFDRKNEKYGADRRFRTHPADRTKRRNVDGRYEEQKPKKRNADRGRVNESRRIKKLPRPSPLRRCAPDSPFCRLRDIFPRPGEVFPQRESQKRGGQAKASPFGRGGTVSAVTERARMLTIEEIPIKRETTGGTPK